MGIYKICMTGKSSAMWTVTAKVLAKLRLNAA